MDVKGFDTRTVPLFLKVRWGWKHCDVCWRRQWTVGSDKEFPSGRLPTIDAEGQPARPYWPMVPLVCGRCGNTKLLSLDVVNNWANSEAGKLKIAKYKGTRWWSENE
jgi:hypothetical protein